MSPWETLDDSGFRDPHHQRQIRRTARAGFRDPHHRRQIRRTADQDGHDRPLGRRHRQALRPDGHVHLRSGLHFDREHGIEDHLYRRRRGRAALSRLSDRRARRARRFPRDLLPAALRRAADRRAEGRLRLSRHAPHHGARADDAVFQRLPPRRASDVGDGGLRRRARRLLSRLDRHQRSVAAPGRLDPHDRQDADARGDGLQIFDRPAVRLSEERPRLLLELPAHVLLGAVRGIQGQSGAGAGARPHLHPPRRPRAERLDLDGPPGGILGRQPVRLHRRRHRVPLGAGARRRQRGGAQDAGRDRHESKTSPNTSPRPRTRTTRSA